MKCLNCRNDAAITKQGKQSEFCSMSCRSRYYSSQTIEKRKQTNLQKYGADNPSKTASIIEKRNKTNLKRYGVDNPFKSLKIQTKQRDTCKERYGVFHPSASPVLRARRDEKMNEKYGVLHNTQLHLTEEVLKFSNDDDWLINQAKTKPAIKIAKDLGVSPYPIHKRLKKLGINGLVHNHSSYENEVYHFLKNCNVSVDRNRRDIISPMEIDLFVPEHHIAIECNGSYWHSEIAGSKHKSYHLNKAEDCRKEGIHLIHLWEHDWYDRQDLIKNRLKTKLGMNEKVYARKTVIEVIDRQTEKKFLSQYHIQGPCRSSVKLGLFLEDELVALMTFGRPRYNKSFDWELLRYCSSKQVIGGASKLFSHFKETQNPGSVISYSDKSWNDGKMYKILGFSFSHTTSPSYYYTKDYINFENRIAYQKHKLKTKLMEFDSELTEWQNMKINGFDRIWDCGNDVWVFIS